MFLEAGRIPWGMKLFFYFFEMEYYYHCFSFIHKDWDQLIHTKRCGLGRIAHTQETQSSAVPSLLLSWSKESSLFHLIVQLSNKLKVRTLLYR